MPLRLIAGPANAGKVELLLDRYLAALEREPDPAGQRGTVAVTTSHMSDEECRSWLEEILNLYTAVVEIEAKQGSVELS